MLMGLPKNMEGLTWVICLCSDGEYVPAVLCVLSLTWDGRGTWWISSSVACSADNGEVTDPDGLVDTTGSDGDSVSLVEAGCAIGGAGGEVTGKLIKF